MSAATSRFVTLSFSFSLISTPPITCVASTLRHAVVFHFPLFNFFLNFLPSRLVRRATLASHLLPCRVSPSSLRHSFIYVTTTCISKPFPSSEEVLLFRPSAGTRGKTRKAVRQPPDPPPSVIREGKFTHLIGGESILGTGAVAGGRGRYEGCYSSVGRVRGEKGEITPVISRLHVQGWREVGTVGVFVGQPGCKLIRAKRLKFSAVKVQQRVNANIYGHLGHNHESPSKILQKCLQPLNNVDNLDLR